MAFKITTKTIGCVTLVAASLQLGACANVDSDDIKTSGIYADVDIESTGTGSTAVEVELTAGNGLVATYVDLDSGDKLTATAGGQTRTLSKQKNWLTNDILYKTSFDFDTQNTRFTIALVRETETDAPDSTVTLPASFTITAPSNGATYGATDTVSVTWDTTGTGYSMAIYARLSCPTSNSTTAITTGYSSTDDGIQDIPVSQLINGVTSDGIIEITGNCSLTATLERKAYGNIDSHYDGGVITATQKRSISVTVTQP